MWLSTSLILSVPLESLFFLFDGTTGMTYVNLDTGLLIAQTIARSLHNSPGRCRMDGAVTKKDRNGLSKMNASNVHTHYAVIIKRILKVECLLTLAIWSYGHEAEEYIFLNLPFPSNPKEISSIRCILSTPEQNLL